MRASLKSSIIQEGQLLSSKDERADLDISIELVNSIFLALHYKMFVDLFIYLHFTFSFPHRMTIPGWRCAVIFDQWT